MGGGRRCQTPLTSYFETSPLQSRAALVSQAAEAYTVLGRITPAWPPASPSPALSLPLPLAAGALSACAFPAVCLSCCSLCEPTCE